jgi:hypothetical protein
MCIEMASVRTAPSLSVIARRVFSLSPSGPALFSCLSPHTVARRALAQNVNETFSAPGVPAIMDFDFVPWGNAYFAAVTGNKTYDRGPGMTSWLEQCGMGVKSPPADCFTGEILCQHGPNECMGNLIEGCVKDLNPTDYWPFVACYEEPPNPSRTDPTCVPSCEQPQASSCPR